MTEFARDLQDRWKAASEADKDARDEIVIDQKFRIGDIWDADIKEDRENDNLPCLTINQSPQFIEQVVGDFIGNAQTIKFLPKEDADKDLAEIRTELARSIMVQSDADTVLMEVLGDAAGCGRSHFRLDLDYASDDVFDRDLFVRGIPNPLAVLADPLATDITLKDAGYIFVNDRMPKDEFERQFPDAKASTLQMSDTAKAQGWIGDNTVRVSEYWRMEEVDRTLAMFKDGSIHDVTEHDEAVYREALFVDDYGNARIRKSPRKFAVMSLTNGEEELDEEFRLPCPRIPIFRVSGHRVWVDDERHEHGLIRFTRDPARLKCYVRSVFAEQLIKAPRDNFIGPASAIKGREEDWPDYRAYNDGAPFAPENVNQQGTAALIQEAQMCAQDMKDVTGLHDASLGIMSNETSGRAIQSRQMQGDIATARYHANLRAAMREMGECMNALIPVVYDTPRTIRLLGEDMAPKLIRVNEADNPDSPDLSKGRYDITVATGPAFLTKRQEAQTGMMEAARSGADLWGRAGDLMAKGLDWPNADEFAERLRPPGVGDEDDPQAQQQAQQVAAMEQEAAMLKMRSLAAETAEKEVSAELKKAQAMETMADAKRAMAEADKVEAEAMKIRAEMTIDAAQIAEAAADEDDAAAMMGEE